MGSKEPGRLHSVFSCHIMRALPCFLLPFPGPSADSPEKRRHALLGFLQHGLGE